MHKSVSFRRMKVTGGRTYDGGVGGRCQSTLHCQTRQNLPRYRIIHSMVYPPTNHQYSSQPHAPNRVLTTILDILMAHRILCRQLMSIRTLVPPVARPLRKERTEVWSVPLVVRIGPRESLEELLACAVGLAKRDGSRRSIFHFSFHYTCVSSVRVGGGRRGTNSSERNTPC